MLSAENDSKDLKMPDDLSLNGRRAHDVILGFLKARGLTYTGGCKAFYSPAEWKERGEEYGKSSELIIVHDGGDLASVLNLDYGQYALHESLQSQLHAIGLYAEACTGWYTAIYKC